MELHESDLSGYGQIKSRERVSTHGEVFTADREVNAMLDLVKPETERIDSRFLEPACGNGNFLAKILERKLAVVRSRYCKSQSAYELNALIAATSIYGIELLPDNVQECRKRLFSIFQREYENIFPKGMQEEYADSIRYIFLRNILLGNALTLKTLDNQPIVFSEWSVLGLQIKRRDFRYETLIQQKTEPGKGDLFFQDAEANKTDLIPRPCQEFPLIYYSKIYTYGNSELQS